jgi:serine/threonine protein kinase
MVRKTQKHKGHSRKRTLRKRTMRKQRGGRPIGGGSYGVVFRPALPCVGAVPPGSRPANHVSKIATPATIQREWVFSQALAKIPDAHTYFAFPDKPCFLNSGHLVAENEFGTASLQQHIAPIAKFGPFQMLQMPDAGTDLGKLRLAANEVIQLFYGLQNLFVGLQDLHKYHLAHRDIKLDNLIAQKMPDGSFKVKFIDVGLMLSLHVDPGVDNQSHLLNYFSVLNEKSGEIYKHPLSYMPFDLILMFKGEHSPPRYTNLVASLTPFNLAYEKWAIDQLKHMGVSPFIQYDNHANMNFFPTFDSYIQIIAQPDGGYANLTLDTRADIYEAADVWCLGLSLLAFWTRFSHQIVLQMRGAGNVSHIVYMKNINFKAESQDDLIPLDLLAATFPRLITKETLDWYKTVANEITLPWNEMCMKMMDPEPLKRPFVDEAFELYKALLPKILQHFKPSAVRQHFPALRIPLAPEVAPVAAVDAAAAAAGGGGGEGGAANNVNMAVSAVSSLESAIPGRPSLLVSPSPANTNMLSSISSLESAVPGRAAAAGASGAAGGGGRRRARRM